jgi:phage anti-repressor protein
MFGQTSFNCGEKNLGLAIGDVKENNLKEIVELKTLLEFVEKELNLEAEDINKLRRKIGFIGHNYEECILERPKLIYRYKKQLNQLRSSFDVGNEILNRKISDDIEVLSTNHFEEESDNKFDPVQEAKNLVNILENTKMSEGPFRKGMEKKFEDDKTRYILSVNALIHEKDTIDYSLLMDSARNIQEHIVEVTLS